ncbi:HalOD1 output domain-containing protein [Halovivax limisalsi]|uniref:HalOD1 output domain-containing protein n=1 Tax=Halovivax limisalsi TaxID=1453760 RepID=UPI001FFD8D31|nr:HalOD1 output domain-containing protein [Halovivax limisalsi]
MDTSSSSRRVDSVDSPPSYRIARTVAEREETDPESLDPPLFGVIDPEALDALVESADDSMRLTFSYLGYTITVDGTGDVELDS